LAVLAKVCAYLSYLALFFAYFYTGWCASFIVDYWRKLLEVNLPGKALPAISLLVLACDRSNGPIVIGLLLGTIFVAVLVWLQRSPRGQAWLPLCVTLAWGLCALHLLAVLLSIYLTMIPVSIYPLMPAKP
jgi:hypothetical protein